MANATRERTIPQIQMPAQHPAPRTQPVSLLAMDALLANDLEHLVHPVDDNGDLLARDPRMTRSG